MVDKSRFCRAERKLCLALGVVMFSVGVLAATHNVSTVTELTNAIARAAGGDTIVLAAGRYDLSTLGEYKSGTSWGTMSTPDANAGKSCLWFNKQLMIEGANTAPWSEKTEAQETILDGGGVASIVYVYSGSARSSSFHHVTFENGVAESGKNGGAIYALGPAGDVSYPRTGLVTNCVFRNCSASSGGGTYAYNAYDSLYENCSALVNGGGAYSEGSNGYKNQATNRFDGCVFRGCSADKGGGLYVNENRETEGPHAGYVANCVFSNCTAQSGGALYERMAGIVRGCRFSCNSSKTGAVYAENLFSSILTNCTFEGNVSIASGGAVGRWNQVIGCSFTGNVATNDGGAAVSCTLVERCGFTNNVALCVAGTGSQGGGALSNVTARSCIFYGNSSTKTGGAMFSGNASNCVFEANSSTNQGGACAWVAATDCSFTGNQAGNRAGAMYYGTAIGCAFTNNYCAKSARGAACAFVTAKECMFSGAGDVSCGSYTLCTFDGVVSSPGSNQQRYVFDSVRNSGAPLAVTNCLVVNCNVDHIANNEGRYSEFVNCTFADNTIGNGSTVIQCNRGTDYQKKANNEYRYFPGTNIIINCIFSGNRRKDGTDADLILWKYTEETDFGYCSLQFANCLYTAGLGNLSHADVLEVVQGDPHFVADDAKFPGVPHYAIRYASAARNAGMNAAWMASATDLAGNARVNDGIVDIGCYECYLPCEGTMLIFR